MLAPLPIQRAMLAVSAAMLLCPAAHAQQQCDPSVARFIQDTQKTIDTLQSIEADRVPMALGTEHTPGNMQWMQAELRRIGEACTRGRDVEAVWRLEKLQGYVLAAHTTAAPRSSCQATSRADAACTRAADAVSGRRTKNVEPTPSRLSANTSP
jgi:hypothetical protein